MYFSIFDGFGPILMVFINQNMQNHDFSLLGEDSHQYFDDPEADFVQKSIFFENFLRNAPKNVSL